MLECEISVLKWLENYFAFKNWYGKVAEIDISKRLRFCKTE